MTDQTPDAFDTEFETQIQTLFATAHPAAGFEDRLVHAMRQQRRLRLTIPTPIRKAALAAAAVLAVGSVGYYGNMAMTGKLNFHPQANREASASNLHQLGLAILNDEQNGDRWDYGGGSDSTQSWASLNGKQKNLNFNYENPFADNKAVSHGWQLKNPDASYAITKELKGDSGANEIEKSPSPYKNMDSILLPNANNDGPTPQKMASIAANSAGGGGYQVDGNGHAVNANNRIGSGGYNGPGLQHDHAVHGNIVTGNVSGLNYFHGNTSDGSGGQMIVKALPQAASLVPTGYDARVDTAAVDATKPNLIEDKRGRVPFPVPPADEPANTVDGLININTASPQVLAEFGNAKQGQTSVSAVPTTAPTDDRKIIRTGSMDFEVDRFDTAQMQITKIVNELGGFVGATDSQKLPNGKVRGSISVRVPPERLDTLVLSLRALGDLKSQQIVASDITKEYTDLESELAADHAMQDRLLELIHNGKGSVKDLLAAENELGTWRTKIEKAEGMIRYYNGQVALSTLNITLSEHNIQTPATAVETETADIGIEADDVEKARNIALKSIDDVKGRVVEAELKRFDAGQLAAKLVADVPPEAAGAVIDQLKMLGKVARLEIQREQKNSDGTNVVTTGTPLHMEIKPTRLLISIYNLANVAPRRTTNVSLAAMDVEAAYTALATAAKTDGGRVVTSSLDRGDLVKATGSLVLEFPPDKFESAMIALHAQGDVLKLALVENTDTQNSTEAKQGLTVQLVSLASVPARESVQQTLAAADVPTAYQSVLNAINTAHARVQSATLNEQDRQNVTADLQLELPRSAAADFDKALSSAGGTIARTSTRAAEAEGTVDSKVQLHLTITSSDHLAPRETTKLQIETADVDKSAGDIQAAALAAGGRVLEATISKDHGKGLARIILDLPLDKSNDVLQQIRNEGTVRGIDASRDPQAPAGRLAHAQIFVEFTTTEAIIADQTGPWSSIRQGLTTSVAGLLWSLQWMIVGACLIVPWLAIGWVGWKVKVRMTKSRITKQ